MKRKDKTIDNVLFPILYRSRRRRVVFLNLYSRFEYECDAMKNCPSSVIPPRLKRYM